MSESADNSLDDFFAKKDKKKAKAKKYTTSDEIAKKLDGKKVEKPPKKTESSSASNPQSFLTEQEDEWKEVEEKEVDYTGLKIQNLQVGDDDRESGDYDEDGSRSKDSANSPWNKNQSATTPEGEVAASEPEPKPAPVASSAAAAAASLPNTAGGKYVPPGKRNQSHAEAAAPMKTTRGNKNAPEIASELHFPSLSSASEPAPAPVTKRAWL